MAKPADATPLPAMIVIDNNYAHLAFPAHLASVILPHMIQLERNYKDHEHIYSPKKGQIDFKLMTSEQHTVMMVIARLDKPEVVS